LQFTPASHVPPPEHIPPAQVCVAPQAWPQLPQFLGSLEKFTQAAPQAEFGGMHWAAQVPAWQIGVFPPQTFPHDPQFLASVDRFTQLMPQAEFGGVHIPVQLPVWQRGVVPPHTFPQEPQFFGSLPVFVHIPLHLCSPVGHGIWQMPLAQVCPEPQAWLQAPQFWGSVDRSTQLWPQAVLGLWHCVLQELASQNGAVVGHTLPQDPQFFGSTCVSTHRPEQSDSLGNAQPPPSTPPSPIGRQFQDVPFFLHSLPGGQ
jgi:hypothetical protein